MNFHSFCLESSDDSLEICCRDKYAFSKMGIDDLWMISL